jgi:hypothetical protein
MIDEMLKMVGVVEDMGKMSRHMSSNKVIGCLA